VKYFAYILRNYLHILNNWLESCFVIVTAFINHKHQTQEPHCGTFNLHGWNLSVKNKSRLESPAGALKEVFENAQCY
jgi:hypothetical protein